MIDHHDYEALGRYALAMAAFQKALKRMREAYLVVANSMNAAEEAADEANKYATAAGRPRIEWKSGY